MTGDGKVSSGLEENEDRTLALKAFWLQNRLPRQEHDTLRPTQIRPQRMGFYNAALTCHLWLL